MEYRVEINPAKEKEFLQLLKAWESLGVVRHYEVFVKYAGEEDNSSLDSSQRRQKKIADTAWEMAEPYKDLLD